MDLRWICDGFAMAGWLAGLHPKVPPRSLFGLKFPKPMIYLVFLRVPLTKYVIYHQLWTSQGLFSGSSSRPARATQNLLCDLPGVTHSKFWASRAGQGWEPQKSTSEVQS